MNTRANTLHRAMPIVAAALGRKFGVHVCVGGDAARTDGTTIHLPALPADSELIPVAWGYLAHEAAHVRYTDFDLYRAAAQRGDALSADIQNILEDVRIEQALAVPYPGTRETLQALLAHLTAAGRMNAPPPDAHPARVLSSFLLLHLRHKVLGDGVLADEATRAEALLRAVFPASTVHRLLGLLTEVRGLASTADAVDLAKRVRALLEAEQEALEPPSSPVSRHGSDDDDPDRDVDGGTDQAPVVADGRAESPTEGDPQAGKAAGPDATNGPGTGAPPSNDPNDAAKRFALSKALQATEDDLPGDLFGTVHDLLQAAGSGHSRCVLPRAEPFAGHARAGRLLLGEVQQESRRLTARLHGLVQAARLDRPQARRRGPRLMPKRLYRAAVGEARVFARKRERVAVHTALHLLIDLSDSMGAPVRSASGAVKRRCDIALASALALSVALDGINGVSVAVSAFPSRAGGAQALSVLVRHGERVRARAGAFIQRERGGTPMAGALWFAVGDLLARPEPRRIVLVLTDGKPDVGSETQASLRLCEAAGVETVGVGIGVDVSALFPAALRVDEVAELKTTLFGVAERLLLVT